MMSAQETELPSLRWDFLSSSDRWVVVRAANCLSPRAPFCNLLLHVDRDVLQRARNTGHADDRIFLTGPLRDRHHPCDPEVQAWMNDSALVEGLAMGTVDISRAQLQAMAIDLMHQRIAQSLQRAAKSAVPIPHQLAVLDTVFDILR